MAPASFLFERDFDAEIEAERHLPVAPTDEVTLRQAELQSLMDAARAEGFAEGETAGREAANAENATSIAAQQAASLSAILPQLDLLVQTAEIARKTRESDLSRLVLTLAERILPEITTSLSQNRLAAFARRAAKMAEGGGLIRLEVAPEMQGALAERVKAQTLFASDAFELHANPDLGPTEARASWLGGHADYAADRLHAPLLHTLRELSLASHTAPVAPDNGAQP